MTNPFLLLFFSIFFGQAIGKIEIKGIKLGSSGGLFVGIFVSYISTKYLMNSGNEDLLKATFVSKELFKLSLIGFIASVGLLASKSIRKTIKENGLKFLILAMTITFAGAVSTYIFSNFLFSSYKASVIGTFVGALTSSPGLAVAMETAKGFSQNAEAMVGLGYSISYIPGVMIVILFVQLIAKNGTSVESLKSKEEDKYGRDFNEVSFNVATFCFVCLIGILVGRIQIYLGSFLGNFSLGSTGGVLISALVLGDVGKIRNLNFNINKRHLGVVRDISLNMFLAIVGLNYGYRALSLIRTSGMQLLISGTITGIVSVGIGYFVGHRFLKLKKIHLIGGICGGMTSTPGLAASIETLKSDEATVGYGATYPFALFFMILFTSILFKL